MDKKNYLDLLLFLTELKAKGGLSEKNDWEIDMHISFLKEYISSIKAKTSCWADIARTRTVNKWLF